MHVVGHSMCGCYPCTIENGEVQCGPGDVTKTVEEHHAALHLFVHQQHQKAWADGIDVSGRIPDCGLYAGWEGEVARWKERARQWRNSE